MTNYYMCILPIGNCVGCNASLYRGGAERRSRTKSKKSATITKEISLHIFHDYHIILQHHHNLCSSCISYDVSKWINNVKDSSVEINRPLSNLLSKKLKPKDEKTPLHFRFEDINEDRCKLFSRLSKCRISEIASSINSSSENVFIFFTIMFRGISQTFASALFGVSQPRISKIFHEIIKKMSEVFVPIYIGSQVFQRNNIIRNHSPEWVRLLLPNAVAMIDSTYIYIEKSWNFNNQKKSYCQYKANNLVKMMAVMLLDGKWFDVYGPYYSDGHNNDELIWNTLSDDNIEVFENNNLLIQRQQLHTTFAKTDMFVGDRGFARCKGKWNLYTPESICKGEKQLTTAKANQTRCITRVRNTIERGFGRLKQWKFVDCVVNTEYIPIIGTIMRILCAVDNAYFSELVTDNDDVLENAKFIVNHLQLENEVISLETNTTGWKKANTSDISRIIPSYDDNDIKKFCGDYSIRIAHAYLGHIQQQWTTFIHRDFPSTIKIINVISRYKTTDNPKKHTVWIRFGKNKLGDTASYCTCKSGLRTAGGPCSHVTAALIASKYWKNNQKIPSFYTTATALFMNVLDCTAYKEKSKYSEISTEDDETISNTESQTSLNEESTIEESTSEKSTDEESTDEDFTTNAPTSQKLTNEEASGDNSNNEDTNKNECYSRKRPRIV